MEKLSDYRCYHNLIFWHRGAFHVSVKRSSGKVAAGLFNEKNRLEKIFSSINFLSREKVAIGFGDNGFEWAARLVVWCNDEVLNTGERWIPCHSDSPLACEKVPEWIRVFCRKLNELFENNPDVKLYIKDIDLKAKLAIDRDCQRLARFVAQHQDQ